MKVNEVLLFFMYVIFKVRSEVNILCTNNVCKDIKCEPVTEFCDNQNATHKGVTFPSPTKCSCCKDYCLEYLREGESCSVGNPSSPPVTKMCGPGLRCVTQSEAEADGVCSIMITDCTNKQDDYDERRLNGTLGSMELRPECDGDGYFASYRCIPGQSCYCVSKNGSRIFGETDFSGVPTFTMQCKCSRDYEEAVLVTGQDLGPHQHFRCSADGGYDELQCIGEKCLCVNPFDGSPNYPDDPMVDIKKISSKKLNCYTGVRPGKYYRSCEAEYFQALENDEIRKDTAFDEIFNYDLPNCDIDGTYKPVQENTTHKMCVDKDNRILTAMNKNNQLAEKMDCKCLRAFSIMSTVEKPNCNKETGNYESIQCRRGTCRCVDSDGNQVCKESPCEVDVQEMNKLVCP